MGAAIWKDSSALSLGRTSARPLRLRGGFSEWRERPVAASTVGQLERPANKRYKSVAICYERNAHAQRSKFSREAGRSEAKIEGGW